MNKDELATELFAAVTAWLERRTAPLADRAGILEDRAKTIEYRLGVLSRNIDKVAADLDHHLQRIRDDIESIKIDRIELP